MSSYGSPRTQESESHYFSLSRHSEELARAALILKSMAHPMRLKLLCTLRNDEWSIAELTDRVGTTQTNVSQHLGVLLKGGLISRRRRGRNHLYQISDKQTLQFIRLVREVFCSQNHGDRKN